MNPGGTALAFLLAGASLWVQATPVGRRLGAFGLVFAGFVVLLALLRIGGYLYAWDGGPDQLMFREKLALEGQRRPSQSDAAQHGGGHPADRSGPAAERSAAIRCVGGGRLALTAALITLLAVIGYAYSTLALAGIEQFMPMALNTGVALALMSLGILVAAGPWVDEDGHERECGRSRPPSPPAGNRDPALGIGLGLRVRPAGRLL